MNGGLSGDIPLSPADWLRHRNAGRNYLLHLTFVPSSGLIPHQSLRKAASAIYRRLLLAATKVDCLVPFFPSAYAVIRRH